MPSARILTPDKRRIIINLHENEGLSPDEIARNINRCRGSGHNVLNNREKQRPSDWSGRPPKRTPDDRQNVFRKAKTAKFTAHQLISVLNLPISVEHARTLLRNDDHLQWIRMKKNA